MRVFKRAGEVSGHINSLKKKGYKIGFVPTMGALHEGHLSLIRASREICDQTICSIFVNPTQFNNPDDLENYPRTVEKDISWLEKENVDVLFLPETEEIYPTNGSRIPEIDLKGLDKILEGKYRPGHFKGVIQVMYLLLDIVAPHKLFMGQKDFQQARLVGIMLEHLKSPIGLIICPIVREKDGLAMSSRNALLSKKIRGKANIVFQTLLWVKDNFDQISDFRLMEKTALERLTITSFYPEYFQIINGYTLKPVVNTSESDYIVACTAVRAGAVRLIDNLVLKVPENDLSISSANADE